jgi:uncharacterized protein (TIGR04255 family)
MTKLPIKIEPCPIMEAIVELKFASGLPKGTIFGIVYNVFKAEYKQFLPLPITQIPENIRENDPNLKFKPLYKISNGIFTIQVGNDVLIFQSPSKYVGWQEFSKNIIDFFIKINQTKIVENPISLLVKYVNFFDIDIFQQINFQIQMLDQPYNSSYIILRTEKEKEEFVEVLQIANNVTLQNNLSKKKGSLLDISLVLKNPNDNFFNDISVIINKAHLLEKKLFFGLLKSDFLKTLNPIYGNE